MISAEFGAIVLAGGKSERLGRDKASEVLLGSPLLQRVIDHLERLVAEIIVVRAVGQTLPEVRADVPVRVVEDLYPESGPLGGLYTGLDAASLEASVAVACDMPLLREALIEELMRLAPGHDVVVPVAEDYAQPLCAVYRRSCLEAIRRRLEAGEFKLMGFYDEVSVLRVPPGVWRRFDAEGVSFQNLNREADLRRAEAVLREEGR